MVGGRQEIRVLRRTRQPGVEAEDEIPAGRRARREPLVLRLFNMDTLNVGVVEAEQFVLAIAGPEPSRLGLGGDCVRRFDKGVVRMPFDYDDCDRV